MPPKRKVPSLGLERRVRPRREGKWEPEPDVESSDEPSEDDVTVRKGNPNDSDEDEEENVSEDDDESDSESEQPPKIDLSSVSFGALARAQASLPSAGRKSKTSKRDDDDHKSTLDSRNFLQKERDSPRTDHKAPKPKRSSKHAPQEQTSKRQVSRMREIIPDTRRKARDPRFDPAVGHIDGPVDEAKVRRAYAFLDEYRDSEMADLRATIKKTKDERTKERLKKQLMSMENKKKAQAKKDDAEKVLSEHRKKEKELVAQGKTPFYLKKSEQKKQLLMNQYEKMSKGQVDRAIERKRKKVAGKERKELDSLVRQR